MSIEDDITKARRRPMDAAKMRELLVKLRKGATASLTFGKILQVLDALGWKVEPALGWTPRHYSYKDKEHLVAADTVRMSLDALDELRSRLLAIQADALPETPIIVGDVVAMDVGEIQQGSSQYGTPIRYFYWREWVGTEGLHVTSPRGDGRTLLIDHHELDRGHRSLADDTSAPSDMWRAFMQMGVEGDINTALGTEKHVPAAERTRENTGTCAACWGNYKLAGGRLVLHGYERPGYGYIKGQCFGVDSQPMETSVDCARAYREFLEGVLAGEERKLAKLESGEVEAIEGRQGKVFKKGEPSFASLLDQEVRNTRYTVNQLKVDLDLYAKVIAAWRPRSMPREGELQRGAGFFLK